MGERISCNSGVRYYLDSELHRTNGPAVMWEWGSHYWFLHGVMHRYYGPANPYQEWWIHGEFIT
jgi:hypothetical protein